MYKVTTTYDKKTIKEVTYLNGRVYKEDFFKKDKVDSMVIHDTKKRNAYSVISLLKGTTKMYYVRDFIDNEIVYQANGFKNEENIVVPIQWTVEYYPKSRKKIKEQKYFWYVKKDLIGCVNYKFYDEDGYLIKAKSHTFEFILDSNFVNIQLISCCVETKNLYIIDNNKKSHLIIATEPNKWKVKYNDYLTIFKTDKTLEGYILIGNKKAFKKAKTDLSFLNDSISSFSFPIK